MLFEAYIPLDTLNPFVALASVDPFICVQQYCGPDSGPNLSSVICVLFVRFFFYGSTERTNRSQQMAASTSKSPKSAIKSQKPSLNKGKGKENISKPAQTNSCAWDARNYDDATPWNWTSLTDPSSTRIPPLFTKDGK